MSDLNPSMWNDTLNERNGAPFVLYRISGVGLPVQIELGVLTAAAESSSNLRSK